MADGDAGNLIQVDNERHETYESLDTIRPLPSPDHHCHENKKRPDVDKRARRKLFIACILSLSFMIGEVIGGIFAHSLAIVSDAAHLLTDLATFMINLLALYLASRRATKKLSFGWYRAEILGALVSILFLWVITGVLCYMAVERVMSMDFEVDATVMLITAACGVAFNLIMGLTLHPGGHGHSHDEERLHLTASVNIQGESNGLYRSFSNSSSDSLATEVKGHSHKGNISVKAAFIHVVGDLLQSVGVLFAAFIIYFKPDWKIADPVCTFVFSLIVLATTVTILRDILVVLMEGTPRSVSFKSIHESLKNIGEVKDIHDLRIWSLSMDKLALSVHIAVDKSTNTFEVQKRASEMIRSQFGITETTIQVEEYVPGTPRSVSFKSIHESLKNIGEVKDIHDLRIWSLSMDKLALSVHITVDKSTNTFEVQKLASDMIKSFGITETTIQVEEYVQGMLD